MAKALQIPYTTIPDSQGATLIRPIVSIQLAYASYSIESNALLDTGADVNLLPYQTGIDLGLQWDTARPIGGLSGNFTQVESRAVILDTVISPFDSVRLLFVWVNTNAARLLLGQINFFQEFNVCFYASRNLFEINPKSRG